MREPFLPSDWSIRPLESVASLCPVQLIDHPAFKLAGIEVAIKREDLLHPALGGNKFYKLYKCIQNARINGDPGVLSFGGAWSNSILAVAYAGRAVGLKTVGVIRGERPRYLSATLLDAERVGMELHFVSRKDYRILTTEPAMLPASLGALKYYTIPEGGNSLRGAKGCQIWAKVSIDMCPWIPTHVCVAGGTGGTLAGVLAACEDVEVHGFMALKGKEAEQAIWRREVQAKAEVLRGTPIQTTGQLWIHDQFHFGGYGKCPAELKEFIKEFQLDTGIPLDPVYTAKMLWGVIRMADSRQWPIGSKLLLLHTGGLQGRRGFNIDWDEAGWSKLSGTDTANG